MSSQELTKNDPVSAPGELTKLKNERTVLVPPDQTAKFGLGLDDVCYARQGDVHRKQAAFTEEKQK